MITLRLGSGMDSRTSSSNTERGQVTPVTGVILFEAILTHNETRVTQLLTSNIKQLITSIDRDGWNAVHYAVWSVAQLTCIMALSHDQSQHVLLLGSSKRILRTLLAHGFSVTTVNRSGVSVLHLAAWYGLDDLLRTALVAGCPVDAHADDSYKYDWKRLQLPGRSLFPRDCDLYDPEGFVTGSRVTPLYLAARAGNEECVRRLISAGAEVLAKRALPGGLGNITALHAAAVHGHVDVIRALVEAGADVNAQTSDGGTALHYAAERGRADIVAILLDGPSLSSCKTSISNSSSVRLSPQKKPVAANTNLLRNRPPDAESVTPLLLAAYSGSEAVLRMLVEHGADVNATMSGGVTALHTVAQQEGCSSLASFLVNCPGCRVDARATIDGCAGLTPLHLATRAGNEATIKILIDAGADRNAVASIGDDLQGIGLMHMAAFGGHADVVRTLISHGVSMNAMSTDGSTPLYLAITEGHGNVVDVLIDSSCSLTSRRSDLLHIAVSQNSECIVRKLIGAGCNINELVQSMNDPTSVISPLSLAVEGGLNEMIKLLVDLGAKVNQNGVGATSLLHTAIDRGDCEMVQRLIEAGASVNKLTGLQEVQNGAHSSGIAPIHVAVLRGQIDIVQTLIKQGAQLDALAIIPEQSDTVQTALHIAVTKQDVQLVQTLIHGGCNVNLKSSQIGGRVSMAALQLACIIEGCPAELVAALLAAKDCKPSLPAFVYDHGHARTVRALHLAAQNGRADLVAMLVRAGSDINAPVVAENADDVEDLATAIHLATDARSEETVRVLIRLGANVNATKRNGWTALHSAAKLNLVSISALLLRAKARTTMKATVDGQMNRLALHVAAQEGNIDVIRLLLSSSGSPLSLVDATENNEEQGLRDVTALHLAADGGSLPTVRALLEHGAVVNRLDSAGLTAVYYAAKAGHLDVVRALLAKRCNVSNTLVASDSLMLSNALPIHAAAEGGHSSIIKFLAAAGSPLDVRRGSLGVTGGYTALHIAAQRGHVKAVKALLELGAYISASTVVETGEKGMEGFLPIDLAVMSDQVEVVHYLLNVQNSPDTLYSPASLTPCTLPEIRVSAASMTPNSTSALTNRMVTSNGLVSQIDHNSATIVVSPAPQEVDLLQPPSAPTSPNAQVHLSQILKTSPIHTTSSVAIEPRETITSRMTRSSSISMTSPSATMLLSSREKRRFSISPVLRHSSSDHRPSSTVQLPAMEPHTQYLLHDAVQHDSRRVTRLLLERWNYDVNERDKRPGHRSFTALHVAAAEGRSFIARLLIEHRADKTLCDDDGRTAYDVALLTGRDQRFCRFLKV